MKVYPFLIVDDFGRFGDVLKFGNILGVLDDLPRMTMPLPYHVGMRRVWVDWLSLDVDKLFLLLSRFDFGEVTEWRLQDLADMYRMYGCNADKFCRALAVIRDLLKRIKDVAVVGEFLSDSAASRFASVVLDGVRLISLGTGKMLSGT